MKIITNKSCAPYFFFLTFSTISSFFYIDFFYFFLGFPIFHFIMTFSFTQSFSPILLYFSFHLNLKCQNVQAGIFFSYFLFLFLFLSQNFFVLFFSFLPSTISFLLYFDFSDVFGYFCKYFFIHSFLPFHIFVSYFSISYVKTHW